MCSIGHSKLSLLFLPRGLRIDLLRRRRRSDCVVQPLGGFVRSTTIFVECMFSTTKLTTTPWLREFDADSNVAEPNKSAHEHAHGHGGSRSISTQLSSRWSERLHFAFRKVCAGSTKNYGFENLRRWLCLRTDTQNAKVGRQNNEISRIIKMY